LGLGLGGFSGFGGSGGGARGHIGYWFRVAKVTDFWQSAQNTPTSVRDYVGPFQYVNGVLTEISTDEGRWTPSGGYEYFIKDHLGNVRVAFGSSGIVQYSDYDPWGLALPALSGDSSTNRLKYNGKEAITEVGASMYDYGARLYDAQIGRMKNPDALAEAFAEVSPYSYGLNNPIFYTDPTGLSVVPANQVTDTNFGSFNTNRDEIGLNAVTVKAQSNNTQQQSGNTQLGGQGQGGLNLSNMPGVGFRKLPDATYENYNTEDGAVDGDDFVDPFLLIIDNLYGLNTSGQYPDTPGQGTVPLFFGGVKPRGAMAKSLLEQAADLVKANGGKNSVTLRTSAKQIRFDLAGKAHAGVPTPHYQIYNKNFVNGVQKSISRASKEATPMTQQDIRLIRKFLEKQ
jgi:RHS repeat-associated protein